MQGILPFGSGERPIVVPAAQEKQNPWAQLPPQILGNAIIGMVQGKIKQKFETEPQQDFMKQLTELQGQAKERSERVGMGQEWDQNTGTWKQSPPSFYDVGGGNSAAMFGGKAYIGPTPEYQKQAQLDEIARRQAGAEKLAQLQGDIQSIHIGQQYDLMGKNAKELSQQRTEENMSVLGATKDENGKWKLPQAEVRVIDGSKYIVTRTTNGEHLEPMATKASVFDANGQPKMGTISRDGKDFTWIQTGDNKVDIVDNGIKMGNAIEFLKNRYGETSDEDVKSKANLSFLEAVSSGKSPSQALLTSTQVADKMVEGKAAAKAEGKKPALSKPLFSWGSSGASPSAPQASPQNTDAQPFGSFSTPTQAQPGAAKQYKSPDEVAADPNLSREQKLRILQGVFGMQ